MTINRDTKSEVEATVRKQVRELVDRVHVLVKWRLSETIESRTLSGATGLFNDAIVVDLMLGVVRGECQNDEPPPLERNPQLTITAPRKGMSRPCLDGWPDGW